MERRRIQAVKLRRIVGLIKALEKMNNDAWVQFIVQHDLPFKPKSMEIAALKNIALVETEKLLNSAA